MGLAISKFNSRENYEGEKYEATVTCKTAEIQNTPQNKNVLDPRSPNIYRTPLNYNEASASPGGTQMNAIQITKQLNLTTDDSIMLRPASQGLLKAMLLRDLDQNAMLDPRSPTQFINRTPMNLKSSQSAATIDESFECSLVETNTPDISYNASTNNDASLPTDEIQLTAAIEESFNEIAITEPKEFLETNFDTSDPVESIPCDPVESIACDPRSPSLNVDRTPLVLKSEPEMTDSFFESISEPENVTIVEAPVTTCESSANNLIYEDVAETGICSTPKRISALQTVPKVRTPLGCLGNMVSQVNNTRPSKHPSLFIEEQQKLAITPKNQKAFPKRLSNNMNSSKIPVFKNNALK